VAAAISGIEAGPAAVGMPFVNPASAAELIAAVPDAAVALPVVAPRTWVTTVGAKVGIAVGI